MPLSDVKQLPISAFRLLIDAWRDEDELQRTMSIRAQYLALSSVSGEDLNTKIG